MPCCPWVGARPPPEICPGAWSPGTEPSALEVNTGGEMGRPEQGCQSRCTLSNHIVKDISIHMLFMQISQKISENKSKDFQHIEILLASPQEAPGGWGGGVVVPEARAGLVPGWRHDLEVQPWWRLTALPPSTTTDSQGRFGPICRVAAVARRSAAAAHRRRERLRCPKLARPPAGRGVRAALRGPGRAHWQPA